jgi:hypothetical protein
MEQRRGADGDGIEIGHALEHLPQGAEIRDARQLRMAARGGSEREGRIGGDARNVLVTRDLANSQNAYTNGLHCFSLFTRRAAASPAI